MAKRRTKKKASAPVGGAADLEPVDDEFPGGVPDVIREPSELDRYIDAAGDLGDWKPAVEVFDRITSVRTCLPGFNEAVRVGGLPVRRIHTVHGPTHGGKTAFVLALVKSFVERGYLAGYADAEHTLGQEFAAEMVADLQRYRNFLAIRPENYEQMISAGDRFLLRSAEVRKKFPDAKSILVVDSINKLVPKRELKNILKAGEADKKGADELAKGHHGRYRAALNQAWLDHLTPLVARADCAVLMIAQEREEDDPADFFAETFKVKGGAALLFDASLVMRVMKAEPVWLPGTEKKSNDAICGWRHRVRIWKSKVGHMDGRYTDGLFHLSNGKLVGKGLDTARDAMVVGAKLGVLKTSGSWYSFGGKRWQGENGVVQGLASDRARLSKLLDAIAQELDIREGRAA